MTSQSIPAVKVTTFNTPPSALSILKVLEDNLDRQNVAFSLLPIAFKSLDPVEVVVLASVSYAFERFILEPLLSDYADKWKAAVTQHFRPYRAFEFTVQFKAGVLKKIYTDPPIASIRGMLSVWRHIGQAQHLIGASPVANEVVIVRLILEDNRKPIAIGLKADLSQVCRVDLDSETIEY